MNAKFVPHINRCIISKKISAPMSRSIFPGTFKVSSAKIPLGMSQILMSILVGDVVFVMFVRMAQSIVPYQSVVLDLKCTEALWEVAMFTSLIP
jgi:hypothetical protein